MNRKKIRRIVVKALGDRDAESVCRYIAESGRCTPDGDSAVVPRPLFSDGRNEIGLRAAATVLGSPHGGGGAVKHFVVCVRPDDRLLRGLSDESKVERLRRLTRRLASVALKAAGAPAASWVAGVHLNTDVPHVHIALRLI